MNKWLTWDQPFWFEPLEQDSNVSNICMCECVYASANKHAHTCIHVHKCERECVCLYMFSLTLGCGQQAYWPPLSWQHVWPSGHSDLPSGHTMLPNLQQSHFNYLSQTHSIANQYLHKQTWKQQYNSITTYMYRIHVRVLCCIMSRVWDGVVYCGLLCCVVLHCIMCLWVCLSVCLIVSACGKWCTWVWESIIILFKIS